MYTLLSLAIWHLPTILFVGLAVAARYAWQYITNKRLFESIPLLDKTYDGKPEHFMFHCAGMFDEGYHKRREEVHRMRTPDGDNIIVPNAYLDHLRQRPDDEIDVTTAFMKLLENDYIHLFPSHNHTHIANSVVKKELTRNLVKINPALSQAVADTVAEVLAGASEEWTPVTIHARLLKIVAIVSGHVFVGPELCRDPVYLDAAVNFTTDITAAVPAVKRWPWIVRPLARYWEPQLAKVEAHRSRMRAFLAPVIADRQARKARGDTEMPSDTLQWMLDKTEAEGITDIAAITNMQLLLTMAAIHTTTLTTTYILHDLVARPEVVEACRQEIKDVLAASGSSTEMTTHALFNMKLVDSVMRESQRLNPPFVDAFRRYTLKPVSLPDGSVLPAGCIVQAANKAVLLDPELYPNPTTFDPYRFVRLRTDPEVDDPLSFKNREQYQFVSVTKENMSFGFGRHACPGRFFAANEIKLILANLLLNYDIKALPVGDGKDGNIGVGGGPDPTREILFRRVKNEK